jgi:hypothetical protein
MACAKHHSEEFFLQALAGGTVDKFSEPRGRWPGKNWEPQGCTNYRVSHGLPHFLEVNTGMLPHTDEDRFLLNPHLQQPTI